MEDGWDIGWLLFSWDCDKLLSWDWGNFWLGACEADWLPLNGWSALLLTPVASIWGSGLLFALTLRLLLDSPLDPPGPGSSSFVPGWYLRSLFSLVQHLFLGFFPMLMGKTAWNRWFWTPAISTKQTSRCYIRITHGLGFHWQCKENLPLMNTCQHQTEDRFPPPSTADWSKDCKLTLILN